VPDDVSENEGSKNDDIAKSDETNCNSSDMFELMEALRSSFVMRFDAIG
jgi:hypothetical protein